PGRPSRVRHPVRDRPARPAPAPRRPPRHRPRPLRRHPPAHRRRGRAGHRMSWTAVLPATVGLALLWVLPGYAVLRLLGARGLLALGAGAAVTTGVAGVLGIAYGLVGIPWTLPTVLLGLLLAVAVAAGIGRLLRTT